MLLLRMTFLAPIYMAKPLMPVWMQRASLVNPVTWTVEAGREALRMSPDWSAVGIRLLTLAVFVMASMWIATRAFRIYQRSM